MREDDQGKMDCPLGSALPPEALVLDQMKQDWNQRARENARWYINTVRLDQTEEEFHQTGLREVELWILPELELLTQGQDPKGLRFLEIGCGIGRMTRPLAAIFGEVVGTDVSGEMIRLARQRLADLSNVSLHETSGRDVGPIPDTSIDIAYSIFVFQHVPSRAAIRSTLLDAWRVLKPGGLLRFQTNGVTTDSFLQAEKNTWIGESFPEAEVRALARELGAQLVSLYGAETMYCFSTLRKPLRPAPPTAPTLQPVLEYLCSTDQPESAEIPIGGPAACLSLLVSGLDRETLDANRLALEIGGRLAPLRYAGPIRPHLRPVVASRLGYLVPLIDTVAYLEAPIPSGLSAGPTALRLFLDGAPVGEGTTVLLVGLPLRPAKIVSVRNLVDFGTDLHLTGPKSHFTVYVEGLDESFSSQSLRIRIGESLLSPEYAGFEPLVASYRLDATLPAGLSPGPMLVELVSPEIAATALEVDLLP